LGGYAAKIEPALKMSIPRTMIFNLPNRSLRYPNGIWKMAWVKAYPLNASPINKGEDVNSLAYIAKIGNTMDIPSILRDSTTESMDKVLF
jgi:hypothetical protein